MKNRLHKLSLLIKDFGILFCLKYCYYKYTRKTDSYLDLVYKYLEKFFADEINDFKQRDFDKEQISTEPSNKIWVCWWQGFDKMPILCKICYSHLKEIIPSNFELVLITKDNYAQYANIPTHIIEKLENNVLNVTQFSDILRNSLLYHNGGTWIDSSIWCNEHFIDYINNNATFWSAKLGHIDDPHVTGQRISQCMWSSFLMHGKKGNPVSEFVYKCMCKYFQEHEYTIDYFLQNISIRLAYLHIPHIHEIIESIPISNPHLYDLYRVMDDAFEEETWQRYNADTSFFKLTQKRPYPETANGMPTFYSHLKQLANIK